MIVAGGVTKPVGAGPTAQPAVGRAARASSASLRRDQGRQDRPATPIHPYKFGNNGTTTGDNLTFDNLPKLFQTLDKAFPGKRYKVWITEYGKADEPAGQVARRVAEQAGVDACAPASASRARTRASSMLIWFLIYDESIAGRPFAGGFQSGLAFVDGGKKPSWNVFKAEARK